MNVCCVNCVYWPLTVRIDSHCCCSPAHTHSRSPLRSLSRCRAQCLENAANRRCPPFVAAGFSRARALVRRCANNKTFYSTNEICVGGAVCNGYTVLRCGVVVIVCSMYFRVMYNEVNSSHCAHLRTGKKTCTCTTNVREKVADLIVFVRQYYEPEMALKWAPGNDNVPLVPCRERTSLNKHNIII